MMARQYSINLTSRASAVERLTCDMRSRVIGQHEAVDALIDTYETILAGLPPLNRPIGNLLFMGPTGTGKTRVVEALAESIFGTADAVLKIDCAEYQHSHEIAKLIGSPPGYLGHRETPPYLTQRRLNAYRTEKHPFTIVLLDEVEKASNALWRLLLGILDKGTLNLDTNETVDFTRTIIVMTSNVGSDEIARISGESGLGFGRSLGNENRRVEDCALAAAKKVFAPEFMNRIDKHVVFGRLTEEQMSQILEIELGRIQTRILRAENNRNFVFSADEAFKRQVLNAGFSKEYGARELKRTLEQMLVRPLSRALATEQIRLGDMVRVRLDDNGKTCLTREKQDVATFAAGGVR